MHRRSRISTQSPPLPAMPIGDACHFLFADVRHGPSSIALRVLATFLDGALRSQFLQREICGTWYLGARPDVGMPVMGTFLRDLVIAGTL